MKQSSYMGFLALIMGIVVGCQPVPNIQKIVLLAPFEGQYRRIGYNALYATRLALTDSMQQNIDILAIDDGGTAHNLQTRYDALINDKTVQGVILVTPLADSLDDGAVPVFPVGQWQIESDNPFQITDGMWLMQISEGIFPANYTIISTAQIPDDGFVDAYLASGQYVPYPNLLASYTYDVTRLIIDIMTGKVGNSAITYQGHYHQFTFDDGQWMGTTAYEYPTEILSIDH